MKGLPVFVVAISRWLSPGHSVARTCNGARARLAGNTSSASWSQIGFVADVERDGLIESPYRALVLRVERELGSGQG